MKPIDLVGPLPGEYLPPLCVSVKQASRLLGIGKTKTWEMIADGRLRTVTLDRKRLVIYECLRNLIKDGEDRSTLTQLLSE